MFRKYGKYSGYFKKIEEYKVKINPANKTLTKEEQEAAEKEDRYCLHWGCERTYRAADNGGRHCLFHPGKWDFGHTGKTVAQTLKDEKTVLWKPHWSCCRKPWKAKGCTRGAHSGPPLSVYEEAPKKYKWPDYRAQIYFKKRISTHWREYMDKQVLNNVRPVEEVFDNFAATKGVDGVLSVSP
eukprot:TRINITY_DN8768_c0_g2_i1.p2 TRINITY_DN8768_c0_g2~~TRINITY_DN8768_c0_g2_i1.p2  ORF type:complete len:183 (+),score=46.44 TRINITY_DN8768_c0_g2_i1:1313-1861(+)